MIECPNCLKISQVKPGNDYCGRSPCNALNSQQKCRQCCVNNVKFGNWYCQTCVMSLFRNVCQGCGVCFPAVSTSVPICPKCDRSPVALSLVDTKDDIRHGTMWRMRI